ncbi:MAG TPA: hypothetical protein VIW47_12455 [Nitrospiraceae bacterium]
MHCPTCQNVMIEEQFFDVEKIEGLMWMRGWKCQQCGHRIDPLIEANRRTMLKIEADQVYAL